MSAAVTAAANLDAAMQLRELITARHTHLGSDLHGVEFAAALADAASGSAATLAKYASGGCQAAADGCNQGALLWHWLRGWLLLSDGDASRAFVDSPERASLFEAHRVYLSDAGWYPKSAVETIHHFYDLLPIRLRRDGVLLGSPFATMTVGDAFKCGNVPFDRNLLNGYPFILSARGYNVFGLGDFQAYNLNDRTENAFGGTGESVSGDLLMTVTRHEVAHQFDRVIVADTSRMLPIFNRLKASATNNEDYLRLGDRAHDFFTKAPQEAVASMCGNQYLLSSHTQLSVAVGRLVASPRISAVAFGWVLLFLELCASPPVSIPTPPPPPPPLPAHASALPIPRPRVCVCAQSPPTTVAARECTRSWEGWSRPKPSACSCSAMTKTASAASPSPVAWESCLSRTTKPRACPTASSRCCPTRPPPPAGRAAGRLWIPRTRSANCRHQRRRPRRRRIPPASLPARRPRRRPRRRRCRRRLQCLHGRRRPGGQMRGSKWSTAASTGGSRRRCCGATATPPRGIYPAGR